MRVRAAAEIVPATTTTAIGRCVSPPTAWDSAAGRSPRRGQKGRHEHGSQAVASALGHRIAKSLAAFETGVDRRQHQDPVEDGLAEQGQ